MNAVTDRHEVRALAGAIYREHAGYLLKIAMQNARNEADAEEAISEALVSFIRGFDPGGGAPALAWLTLTLKRQCWRQTRDAHLDCYVGQEVERGDDGPGAILEQLPAPGADPQEWIVEVDEARDRLAALKPNERTALGAFAVGFSYREIGERLSWTFTKVSRCIREGRMALAPA